MSTTSQALILKASAGSGKTFALAKEFIKLLVLDPTEYHQILALTFTNDAKNEMKSRVLDELSKLASNESTDMLSAILEDFDEAKRGLTKEQIILRSKLALNNLLNDYSRFNVNTLDHFFTQLIRHLSRELKLNLGYELDLDNDKALREAIHSLYNTTDKRVKKWLRSFINSKIEDDKGWNIEYNIHNLGGKLFQDSFIDIRDTLNKNAEHLEAFVNQLRAQAKTYETSMQKLAQQAIELITSHQLAIADFKRGSASVFQQLCEGNFDLRSEFKVTFAKGDWSTKSADRKDDIEACVANGLNNIHTQVLELSESKQKQAYMEANALLPNIYSYGVLSALSENLWNYRTSNNLLLLSDTAFILHGVISKSDAPFIYEKIGARYKHIMIDEFQDTSTHQWQNILPLLQHALFNEGTVMLVGDVKQSIYRWRGGDVNLLMQQAADDLAEHSPQQKPLDTNYRSAKNIIAFNNAFFETARQVAPELIEGIGDKAEALQKAYQDVHQQPKKALEGYVKAQFFTDDEEHSWKEKAQQATLKTIQQALAEGYAPEEIMVLVRRNKEAAEVAEYLLHQGINTLTDEALYLEKSPLVQFMVSALQLALTPQDEFVKANFSYFYNLLKSKNATEALASPIEPPTQTTSQNKSAYEAIELLVEQFHLEKSFDPFLQGFQDVCLTQAKKGFSSIASFLERWHELNDEGNNPTIVLGTAKGAVQVKSIHKSKGLERPVVIMPEVGGSFFNARHIFWPTDLPDTYKKWGSLALPFTSKLAETQFANTYQKESFEIVLEELNTLYVAFTRAAERLYIFVNGSETKNTIQKLIKGVLGHPTFELTNRLQEDVFEFGSTETKQEPQEKTTESILLNAYPVSNPETKLSPQTSSEFWKKLQSNTASSIRDGIALHAIMAQLKHVEINQLAGHLESTMDKMILRGQMSAAKKSAYKEKIMALFEANQELLIWNSADWEVLNEHKIFANGETYIPDRVAIKEGEAILIDYKREQKADSHKRQIQQYSALLEKMQYTVAGKYLVYIENMEVVEVE